MDMYCPKCGAEGNDGQNYCRKCGVNLALVTKAVRIGDTIARGDSGLLPKIKTVMGNMKLDEMSEQISRHMDQISHEVERGGRAMWEAHKSNDEWKWWKRRSPAERRARLLEKGFSGFFGGMAFTAVLYVIGHYVPFNIPPDRLARIPFDVPALIDLAWMFGLIPTFGGLGQVIAGFCIPPHEKSIEKAPTAPMLEESPAVEFDEAPPSVTEQTTARLDARIRQ